MEFGLKYIRSFYVLVYCQDYPSIAGKAKLWTADQLKIQNCDVNV